MAWNIPPCVSNWKNAKGFTIPLEMRLSADGRNLKNVRKLKIFEFNLILFNIYLFILL
jgi:hypothetical protein